MTNQNVIVSSQGNKSKPITNTALLSSSAIPKTPSLTSTQRFIISRRKLLKKLEPNGASKINPLVDSMRSSSPTHLLQHNHSNYSSWMANHPSALEMFEQMMNASMGKQIVMFLDYDGTLSPIVQDPDQAFMSHGMKATLGEVAKTFPTAIVTGRCLDKIWSFVKLPELYYAGSHGMDIKGPSKGTQPEIRFQAAIEFLPMIDEVYKVLMEKTRYITGVTLENNIFCASVHFRRVDEKKWSELADKVREVMVEYPNLRLTQGRKVLEIRPSVKWDKGKALEFLSESLGFTNSDDVFPVYIGDDRTDEDAFNVLRERNQGFGILVSKFPKETNASYTLQDPSEVKSFLQRLVEWKYMSTRRNTLGLEL